MRYTPLPPNLFKPFLGASQLLVLAVGLSIVPIRTPSAQALDFTFGSTSTLSQEMIDGLNMAGDNWSSVFTDDITVNLSVGAEGFSSSALGSFRPSRVNVSYQDFVNGLSSDSNLSADDRTALNFLPKSNDFDLLLNPEFDLLINGTRNHPSGQPGNLNPYVDADGDCNNRSIRLTTANARALGLPGGGTSNCSNRASNSVNDGTLSFNSNTRWDFDPSDGIDAGSYDFVGVATQGLGVILGMVSGVDVLDFNTTKGPSDNPVFFDDEILSFVSPSDLFRFSEDSVNLASENDSQNLIDWTTGRTNAQGQEVDKYFSIDGGQTKIASFSTGQKFGDGNRASSWKADDLTGEYLGIFEPSPATGQRLFITENDRRILDVTGWDLDPAVQPPDGPPNSQPPRPKPPTPPPDSVAVPEAGHGLGAAVLVAIALGRYLRNRSRR